MPSRIKINEYLGKKYNELTILEEVGSRNGRRLVKCQCDCGNIIIAELRTVARGSKKSCGCRQKRLLIERNYKHGYSKRGAKDRLYTIWCGIKYRCHARKGLDYEEYAARGIAICSEWENDYNAFRKWAYSNGYDENAKFGECTIDRIDVNGNYEPSNCRWVSNAVQQNNKRTNNKISYKGETHTLTEWSRIIGINQGTLQTRYETGYRGDDLFFVGNLRRRERRIS